MTGDAEIAATGRLLGLDVGERRLGVAISDPEQRLAVPLTTIDARQSRDALDQVHRLADAEAAAGIVIGLPLSLSGEAGEQAERVRQFARALQKTVNLPVAFWDERLSSQEADRMLGSVPGYPGGGRGRHGPDRGSRRGPSAGSGRGPARRPDRGATDVVAATIILQAFLDSRRGLRFEE